MRLLWARAAPTACTHIDFTVFDIDDVGRARHRMTKGRRKDRLRDGAAPPSGVFLYFFDPDALTVEYSSGKDEVPEVGAHEPSMLVRVPESLATWGAVPDPEFGKQGAIEAT